MDETNLWIIDERLAYRLPTETEWRKAVQAWRFPWGDAWPPHP